MASQDIWDRGPGGLGCSRVKVYTLTPHSSSFLGVIFRASGYMYMYTSSVPYASLDSWIWGVLIAVICSPDALLCVQKVSERVCL